jgi:hypothetical protein
MNYLPAKQPSIDNPKTITERGMNELRPSMQKPYVLVLNNQFR